MDVGALGAALVAAFVIERLVEAVIAPLFDKFKWDRFWLLYIAWAVGGGLAWATGLNALPVFAESAVVGRVLTCMLVGLGSSFIYDLVDNQPSL
jgi:hypothetical protein